MICEGWLKSYGLTILSGNMIDSMLGRRRPSHTTRLLQRMDLIFAPYMMAARCPLLALAEKLGTFHCLVVLLLFQAPCYILKSVLT